MLVSTVALIWQLKSPAERLELSFTQLTAESREELFPSLSPDGQSFVYASQASGNWDIYQRRVGGQAAFNLTEDSLADDTHPAVSPDGKQIAFRSERDGGGIFVMGATGESARRLTDFCYFPAWSPDGRHLACSTDLFEDPVGLSTTLSQLWTVEVATGDARLISDEEEGARQPQWSPNGQRIAYWSAPGGIRDLWTVPSDGGPAARVTDDRFTDVSPVWSADGRYLYFSTDRTGTFNIWRVGIDETSGRTLGEAEPVTAGVGASDQWLSISRDGRHLAYVSRVERTLIKKIAFDPVSGGTLGEPAVVYESSVRVNGPTPSPDGEWLAVQVWDKRGNIGLMRTDGTGLRKLTDDGSRDRAPAWSPDGKRLYFYSNRDGTNQLWEVNADGSGLHKITDVPGEIAGHALSPDGAQMFVAPIIGGGLVLFDPSKPWREQSPRELRARDGSAGYFLMGGWSPDGQRVAFNRVRGGIILFVLETEEYHVLSDTGIGRPHWLKDSRRLLFRDEGQIRLLDTVSKEQSTVFAPARGELGFWGLSPDNRVLYFNLREPPEADVWLVTLDGAR